MGNENDLIQKLMISKKIMDRHNVIPRSGNSATDILPSSPELASFNPPQANYNIPQEFLAESKPITQQPKATTKDRILSSKLPDEIKKLMIEHPITQPDSVQSTKLSNDIVEKAARLMNVDASGKQINNTYPKQSTQSYVNHSSSNIDPDTIKQIVRETIEEVLSENGLLVESVSKSNDVFSFKVGKHLFEGKLTKIKKLR